MKESEEEVEEKKGKKYHVVLEPSPSLKVLQAILPNSVITGYCSNPL